MADLSARSRGEGPSAAGGAECHARLAAGGPHTWEGIDTNHQPDRHIAISRPFMSSNTEPRRLPSPPLQMLQPVMITGHSPAPWWQGCV